MVTTISHLPHQTFIFNSLEFKRGKAYGIQSIVSPDLSHVKQPSRLLEAGKSLSPIPCLWDSWTLCPRPIKRKGSFITENLLIFHLFDYWSILQPFWVEDVAACKEDFNRLRRTLEWHWWLTLYFSFIRWNNKFWKNQKESYSPLVI